MNHAHIMRGYRIKNSLTQPQAAAALRVSQSCISKVENGTLDMSVDVLEVIYFSITGQALLSFFVQLAMSGYQAKLEDEEKRKIKAAAAVARKKKKKKKPAR